MTRVLLVTLDVDPGEDLALLAESVHETLEQSGFPIADVKPWNMGGIELNPSIAPLRIIPPPVGFTGN